MNFAADAPLALIGFSPSAARALRDLGLNALSVPGEPLPEVLDALKVLRFGGALVATDCQEAAFGNVQPDAAARKVGRVDALALLGEARGTRGGGAGGLGIHRPIRGRRRGQAHRRHPLAHR